MAAVLEIFNKDGSLRFSSEQFKVLKYYGEVKVLKSLNIRTRSNNTTQWYVDIVLTIPASPKPNLLLVPFLGLCQLQKPTAYDYSTSTILIWPNSVPKQTVIDECNRPGFIIGT